MAYYKGSHQIAGVMPIDSSLNEESGNAVSNSVITEEFKKTQPKLSSENEGTNVTITEEGGIMKINSTGGGYAPDGSTIILNTENKLSANIVDLSEAEYKKKKEEHTLDPDTTYRTPENTQTYVGINEIFDVIYPVGSIYVSIGDTIPTVFKGVWERLPNEYYLVSSDTNQGTELDAELPNIKGVVGDNQQTGLIRNLNGSTYSSGALYLTKDGKTVTAHPMFTGGESGSNPMFIGLDASKRTLQEGEAAIYKDGGKVQPKSIQCSMWKRTL